MDIKITKATELKAKPTLCREASLGSANVSPSYVHDEL